MLSVRATLGCRSPTVALRGNIGMMRRQPANRLRTGCEQGGNAWRISVDPSRALPSGGAAENSRRRSGPRWQQESGGSPRGRNLACRPAGHLVTSGATPSSVATPDACADTPSDRCACPPPLPPRFSRPGKGDRLQDDSQLSPCTPRRTPPAPCRRDACVWRRVCVVGWTWVRE